MNKLIIAGNGFDLAHGLPTSYNHFMDAFWRDLKDDYEDELVKEIVYIHPAFNGFLSFPDGESIFNYLDFKNAISLYLETSNFYNYSLNSYSITPSESSYPNKENKIQIFKFNNDFFKKLNEKSIENWVDVENEYYQALKSISKDENIATRKKRDKVVRLHKEFEEVKQLLERYLQKHVVGEYDFRNPQSDHYYMYNSNREQITNVVDYIEPAKDFLFYIVNFNYTPTLELFYSAKSNEINHIHGKLNENIVFGFGDEMDDDYKLIENIDDNEYLKYFKSFQYVQNSNYKNVLRYVDSEKFQVIIMGHSCGLSDRTLLNTIFEHDNCRFIKVFYHKYGEKEGEDNYTEIIQNVSRHFNDKELMRTKIVEKTLCEPMPQIQLPKKE